MPAPLLKIQLSLKGRPIREYTFSRNSISIGRDPQGDIYIDNLGVSRAHARIVASGETWEIEDCRSANGTWINGQRVERATLSDRDEITIGKFSLRVVLASERRGPGAAISAHPTAGATPFEGTTVLTHGQLATILEMTRDGEAGVDYESARTGAVATIVRQWRRRMVLGIVFSIAMAAGAALTMLLMR